VVLGAPTGWLIFAAAVLVAGLVASERNISWMLPFSLVYPLLGVWFLWGGTLWGPIFVLVGPLLGWLAWRALSRVSPMLATVVAILVTVLFWLVLAGDAARDAEALLPLSIDAVRSDRFGGFLLSLTIGVAGIALSLPLGIVLALARQSDMFLIKSLAVIFIEFIRGVPLITLLFVASLLLNYFLPPGTNFDIILRVIIMVTIFAAAYMAEVIRGGLAALPKGQYEAADALGLDYWKAQRLIVLPQALKISIPGIVSTFIGMFKDTTLVTFVGLYDPLKSMSDAVRANVEWKGIYWEPFIFVGAIFFLICFGMSRYSMYLERRLQRDH
ncbi:MAG: amino acid ABC transporter permease, partial [Methyloversatilis sp.]|nr:amino acid ABC transporter permease [Methyloversatilis sp.]